MTLELDAGNFREQDEWDQTARRRQGGQEPPRWHWMWTGTVFRLDQRARAAGGHRGSAGRAL